MDTQTTRQAVTCNLADAGCGEALIGRFWELVDAGQQKACLALLAKHRQSLLDHCHAEQRKIECLDYLIYQMEQDALRSEEHSKQNKGRASGAAIQSGGTESWKKH